MDWKKIIVICYMVLLFIDPSRRLIEPKIWIYAGLLYIYQLDFIKLH